MPDPGHLEHPARAEHHDGARVRLRHRLQHLDLGRGQGEVLAVQALGLGGLGLAEHQHGHLGDPGGGDRLGEQLRVRGAVAVEPGREAAELQVALPDRLQEGRDPGGVDCGGARALIARGAGEVADQGDRGARCQREDPFLVAQQHHRRRRCPPGQCVVGLLVDALDLAGPRDAVDQVHHLGDPSVEIGHRHLAALDRLRDPAGEVVAGRGHGEGPPGRDRGDGVADPAPVRDDGPVEAPLLPQDPLQQERVLVRIGAVDAVVGGHQRPGGRFPHDDLERGQVQLPQGPLVDHRVADHAAQLLAVDREVLRGRGHALRLDTADVRRGDPAGQLRVLREVLEVPAAQRAALDVEPGPEEDVHALLRGLPSERPADLLGEVHVPAGADPHGRGEGRRGLRAVQTEVVGRSELLAQPVRAVRHPDLLDAEAGHGTGLPVVLPAQQCRLLDQGELGEDPGARGRRRLRHRSLLRGRGALLHVMPPRSRDARPGAGGPG